MVERSRRHRVEVGRGSGGEILWMALAADRLVLLRAGGEVEVLALHPGGAGAAPFRSRSFAWGPGWLAAAASGRYVQILGARGVGVAIWEIDTDRLVLHEPAQQASASAFMELDGRLLVVSSPGVGAMLEGRYLDDGTKALQHGSPSYIVDQVIPPLTGGDAFFTLGHCKGESLDELYVFSLRSLVTGQRSGPVLPPGLDYAYRLAVGPAGADSAVVFRDPEDAEEEDDEQHEEIWGFRGLYVRRLSDRAIVEKLPCDAPVRTGDGLFATPAAVAIAYAGALAIVPRSAEVEAETIPARLTAIDPPRARAAVLVAEDAVEIVEVPG